MLSSKVILVQFVVVACLAGLVFSANLDELTNEIIKPLTGFVCEGCQKVTSELKNHAQEIKAYLDQLCQVYDDQNQRDRCTKTFDNFTDILEKYTPIEMCQQLYMCWV